MGGREVVAVLQAAERSERSSAMWSTESLWILRCAQNDNLRWSPFDRLRAVSRFDKLKALSQSKGLSNGAASRRAHEPNAPGLLR